MDPDSLTPFAYELIWFVGGALALQIGGFGLHLAIVALLFIGGMAGAIVRNNDPEERPIR